MLKASIVIPVYNEAKDLEINLNVLRSQTYPQELFEIIVVDNGSTDNTEELVKRYEGVKYILQDEYLNSSYSSRNRGIEQARGEVVVLLDGTVIPKKKWLEAGLDCMETQDADIVTSNVRFDFDGKVTAGKLYDTNNATMERQVKNRGVAVTASLFVRKKLFDELGVFREGAVTAEDILWTWNATRNGYKLVFCDQSRASKKAKPFSKLLKKQWREAKGYPVIWDKQGRRIRIYKKFLRSLLPPPPGKVDTLLQNTDIRVNTYQKVKLYFATWLILIVMSTGHIYGTHLLDKEKSGAEKDVVIVEQ